MNRPDRRSVQSGEELFPSFARRLWNQIVTTLSDRQVDFIYSTDYQVDLGSTPIDSLRAQRIITHLFSQGMIGAKQIYRPELASLKDLALAHSKQYLQQLHNPSSVREIVGFPVWPDLHERLLQAQRSATEGSVVAATRALETGGIVVNLGGGFHHANHGSGRGFCVFNDVAVAVRKLRATGFDSPVLIVDLDLHDGNGTREIFADDNTVFTFSIHNQHWSHDDASASLSVELMGDVDDSRYLQTLREHLPTLIEEVDPALVFYLAGTDPAHDDQIGNWQITPAGMLARDQFVIEEIREKGGEQRPVVVLLAGGYGFETWRYSARFFAWLLTNSTRREPPSTTEMTLARYRSLARHLSAADLDQEKATEDWGLTEADLVGDLGSTGGSSKFLGYYTRHALELAIEWAGLFDRLRSLGFYCPYLDLDLSNPSGHTVRLFADSTKAELLVELRLRIETSIVTEVRLLKIEWLLMQNPRAQFSHAKPRLPQQTHPGLGLVSDVISLLIVICDRLELDGIVFIPSHYHLVIKALHHLHFLHAEDRRWFEAVRTAVGDLSLLEATQVVAADRIGDRRDGSRIGWRAMPLVLPISESFSDRVERNEADSSSQPQARRFDFEVCPAVDDQ